MSDVSAQNPSALDSILPAIESPNKLFLEGPFGAGKTTLAIHRLMWLLGQEKVRGAEILVLTPQRTLARPYVTALRRPGVPPGSPVQVTTVAGLARRSAELYWPLVSSGAGFANPSQEPIFLNLETSQYHMGPIVDGALANGAFQGIRVERNRIISQVLDNLNKAALNGFTIDEAYVRLEATAPPGEQHAASLNALRSARDISRQFRALCLARNLVDYSLQIELFNQHILRNEWSRTHLLRSVHHLVYDNIEEDTFTAHSLVESWIGSLDSALLVADQDGGVRLFLGAAPDGVARLRPLCDRTIHVEASYTMSRQVRVLERHSVLLLDPAHRSRRDGFERPESGAEEVPAEALQDTERAPAIVLPATSFRFYPQMIDWIADEIASLVDKYAVSPDQIVVLAPYMSDALRFSLQTALQSHGVPSTTHRPSRPLRNEPAARTLLTLAALCHPYWRIVPSNTDVAAMFSSAIDAADPIRASLLASNCYRPKSGTPELSPFETLQGASRQRVSYLVGERYDHLRDWIYAYRSELEPEPLDHYWSRLFGEILSQPDYAYHDDMDAARVIFQLVSAARNFRWAIEPSLRSEPEELRADTGLEFCRLVEAGAVGALFPGGWKEQEDAVLIAPAYTFLMRNRAVNYQFWLDVGSPGWWERLYQPLTHPYVLSRSWPAGRPWTDLDEYTARQRSMRRLVLGLLRRTRQGVYMGLSQYSESGYEQRGPLLTFVNRLLSQSGTAIAEYVS